MSAQAPRVIVTQVPSIRDPATGVWKPTINLNPAKEFGEIEVLLPPGMQMYAGTEVVRIIRARLAEIDVHPGDYLLLAGSPTIMGVAAAIISRRNNDQLKLLQWDKTTTSYNVIDAEHLN
jgi:hypothetical protein